MALDRDRGLAGRSPRRLLAWICGVLCLFILTVSGTHAQPAPLRIAAAMSLTGPGSYVVQPVLDGARLAVEEANSRHDGPEVELVVSDDGSVPRVAGEQAREIAASDALAVVGPSLTVSAMVTGPIFAQAGLAAVAGTAHGDDVPGFATTFQPVFNTGQMGAMLANYLFHVLHGHRAVALFRDDAYGRPIIAGFQRTAERVGIDVTIHGFTNQAERAEAARLAASEADHPAIILGMLPFDAIPLLTALRRAGVMAPILGPSSISGDDFAQQFAGEPEEATNPGFFTNNLYTTSPLMFDSADYATVGFAKRFRDRFNKDPSWSAAQGCDSAVLAIAAVRHAAQAAGTADVSTRRKAALDYLLSLNGPEHALAGVTGPLWFTPNRGRDQAERIGRFQNGLFESAPIQLVPVRSFDAADLASGAVIDLGDGHFVRRQIVAFTGLLLNEVSRLDMTQSRFSADLYVWLRYPENTEGASANPDDIVFPDLIRGSSDGKQPARAAVLDDGMRYRLWRVRGDFRNEFDLRRFPVDRQTLTVRFFNGHAASDSIIYAQDRRTPSSDTMSPASSDTMSPDGRRLGGTGTDTFREVPQWEPLNAVVGRDTLVTRSGLGNPRLIGLEQVREQSGFGIEVELRRRIVPTLLKNLLPLALMTLIVYSTLHFPPHLLKEKVTVTVTGALSGAVLLSSINSQLGGVGYVLAVEYLFYAFFALSLFCIVSFVTTERLRVTRRAALVVRIELLSRFVYLGLLSIVLVIAMVVGAAWYGS